MRRGSSILAAALALAAFAGPGAQVGRSTSPRRAALDFDGPGNAGGYRKRGGTHKQKRRIQMAKNARRAARRRGR